MSRAMFALAVILAVAAPLAPRQAAAGVAKCFAMTDTSPGRLIYVVPNSGISPLPSYLDVTLTGARTSFNGEGSAYRPSNQKMYLFQCAADNAAPCDLYEATVDFSTSPNPTATTVLVQADIVPSGAVGAVEGAIFETQADGTEFLYAAVGESDGGSIQGQIYKWDPNNSWAVETGYPINITGAASFLTGLAYESASDSFYGAINLTGGINPRIYSINLTTGATVLLGSVEDEIDGEGYAFGADGKQYMEDEADFSDFGIPYIHEIDQVSPPFGTTPSAIITDYNVTARDYESIACNDPERSDFGDAPTSYGVAVHSIPVFDATPSPVHLGPLRPDNDADPVSQSGAGADGDDNTATEPNGSGNDEDGVTLTGTSLQDQNLNLGSSYTLVVATNGTDSGYLNAWFDLNADGDFDDAGEQIAANLAGTSGGTINVPVTIPPTTAAGPTYARFRYSTEQNLPSEDDFLTGAEAGDGEVEDYRVVLNAGSDLQVTKSGSPDPVRIGENLTYTITVTNNGPGAATGVTINDSLPAGVTHVSTTPSQGSCSDPDGVVCELGTLGFPGSATVTVVVTVN